MNIKKTLAGIASYALVGAVAAGIGGTLALQQDETATAANTYTVGDVSIKQIEMERIEQDDKKNTADNLKAYENNKPLYPACGEIAWAGDDEGSRIYQQWKTGGSSALFDADLLGNVQDKMVFVENDGSNPAYVRTVFAFEAGNMTAAEMNNKLIHWNRNADQWEWTDFSEDMSTVIKGEKYYLRVATYIGNAGTNKDVHKDGILPAGETTRPSLLQLFLDEKADNELCESFNGSYDILVASQAVQIEMNGLTKGDALDEAFGKIDANNHPWMETTFAESEDDLIGGGDVIITDAELALTGATTTISQPTTITNNGVISASRTAATAAESSVLNVTADTTLTGSGTVQNDIDYCLNLNDGATLTIEDGTYKGVCTAVNVVKGTLYIKGGTFEEASTSDNGHFLINCYDANYKNGSAKVVITGGKFKNWNPANNTSEGAGTNFVADGYTVTSETDANGDVWYTVVAE